MTFAYAPLSYRHMRWMPLLRSLSRAYADAGDGDHGESDVQVALAGGRMTPGS
jgi:hypothetical protein